MDDGDWTPAKMVSPVDGFFSDSMGISPSTSLINAIGAPVLPVPGRVEDDVSLSLSLSIDRHLAEHVPGDREEELTTVNEGRPIQ